MSPVQEIVTFAIQTYFKHYSTPEQSTLLTTDVSLATDSAKDSMIEVLDHLQALVTEEMTRQSTQLKRRRNHEHARIYQLPQEIFAEIMLAATSFGSYITDAFTLMRVSKYWFDTVAQCPHIWSPFDLSTRPQPGMMTMMRALRGPVKVQCRSAPHANLNGALAFLSTLDHTRLQGLAWNWSAKSEALHPFFQEINPNLVSLHVYGGYRGRLDLSPEGPCLRHLNLRGVTLPWTSPRLSRLQTLSIENLEHNAPSFHDLYRILKSSPALRRIRVEHFGSSSLEQFDASARAIKEPILLPELHSLHLYGVPSVIITTLAPLIRSPYCQYLHLHPNNQRSWHQVPEPWQRLEPSKEILDLIISSITYKSTLNIQVEDNTDRLSVFIVHGPDWDTVPGRELFVKLFPSTVEALRSLLDELNSRLQAACWKPKELKLSFAASEKTSQSVTETIQALLLNFPLTFQTITRLDLYLPSPSASCSALRLLEDQIPELTSLVLYTRSDGREELANGIRAFLERRYPLRLQGGPSCRQTVSRLEKIYVERDVVECLRSKWAATSLLMEEVLSTYRYIAGQ
ncbi:hypothetical protein FRC00_006184 [Tulasnella sp. 408]|nr:hypothetical protein FRC00_006184 [Tulasnella sp. 408]